MQIDIQSRDIELDKAIKTHIQRKLQIALSRMESHITEISIIISDVDGLNEGGDKRCLIKISSSEFEDIIIEDIQLDLFYVIDRAIHRASRSLELKIGQV